MRARVAPAPPMASQIDTSLHMSALDTTATVLDTGFRIYRRSVRRYLTITATPFILLLLPGLLYLSSPTLDPGRQVRVMLLGLNPSIILSGGYGLFGAFFRDLCFVDGVLWWTIMAGVFAAQPVSPLLKQTERRRQREWIFLQSLKLALVLSLPTLLVRTANLGPLADLVRFPTLFTALLVLRERQPLRSAIQQSWSMARKEWQRCLLVFVLLLVLLRVVEITPLVIPLVIYYWQPEVADLIYNQGQGYFALFAFFAQLALAPVVQISVEQLYANIYPSRNE
jgi:hypothetical protein